MKKTSEKMTWLILAHCYNMDGRAASQTITDRIPFLRKKGVAPVVISAPTGRKDIDYPHYQVFSPAPSGLKFELRHVMKSRAQDTLPGRIINLLLTMILVPFFLLEKTVIHLDSHWSWLLSASLYGIFIIPKHCPELIYSTAGPSSTHYTGLILSRLFKLPWVAELHDPLIYDNETPKWHKYFFHKYLEKLIFRYADKIIYFTDQAGDKALKRNPGFTDKLIVIRPGASPAENWTQTYQKQEKIHFGYFGSLASRRNLKKVFKAFHGMFPEEPDLSRLVAIDIYGTTLDPVTSEALDAYHLEDIVTVHGRLEYDPTTGKTGREQVLEAMKRMDVLILVHGDDIFRCDEYVPSKLYDYMLVQRPILGLTHPGSELQTMLENNGFFAADSQNEEEIKSTILNLIAQWKNTGLPDCEHVSPLTVKEAVSQLMSIRSDLVKGR
jgi:glycosyltransferase involved in cell wall biosynthesis